MLQFGQNKEINVEEIFSTLMKRKRMVERFRFPYSTRQMYDLLMVACRAEVASRRREFVPDEGYMRHVADVARWLTGTDTTFGLFLCGNRGNGKTTLARALKSLYVFLHSDERRTTRDDGQFPKPGFEIITAKELVLLAKAFSNRTRDNMSDVGRYRRLRDVEVLCIDDLGTEPQESLHYGEYVNAAMDMISYRYNEQLCTMATSNLAPDEIRKYYDERFADRLREMMHIVDFGNEPSFRTLKTTITP